MQFNFTDANPAADRFRPITTVFQPLHDRVLVRRLPGELTGRIILPEVAQKASRRGIVVACGPGKRGADGSRRPLDVKPGDLIEFGRFTDHDDGDLLLIQEADVVGIITEGD